jgi:hypothetical protein
VGWHRAVADCAVRCGGAWSGLCSGAVAARGAAWRDDEIAVWAVFGGGDLGGLDLAAVRKGRKQFFFEKKNQKTFFCLVPYRTGSVIRWLAATDKSFLVLFFKKELLPSLPL